MARSRATRTSSSAVAPGKSCTRVTKREPMVGECRFEARRFEAYEKGVWRGITPFFRFIHKYYEPAFLELFLKPRNYLGVRDAVLTVLSGGAFFGMPHWAKGSLAVLFALTRLKVATRRRAGLPVESRLEW